MNNEQLKKHQIRLAVGIKIIHAKSLKQFQAHILCRSLINMLGNKQ